MGDVGESILRNVLQEEKKTKENGCCSMNRASIVHHSPAAGKSILFNTGIISRSFSIARYTLARVF